MRKLAIDDRENDAYKDELYKSLGLDQLDPKCGSATATIITGNCGTFRFVGTSLLS